QRAAVSAAMPAQEGIPGSPQESHPAGSTPYPSSGASITFVWHIRTKAAVQGTYVRYRRRGRASNVRHDVTLQKPANPGSDSDDNPSLATHVEYKFRESKNAAARRKTRFASGPVLRAI